MPSGKLRRRAGRRAVQPFGIVFYSIERVRYFHAVWHLFVLAGTAFHFFAVMNYA